MNNIVVGVNSDKGGKEVAGVGIQHDCPTGTLAHNAA
jgi:hypothetical protein